MSTLIEEVVDDPADFVPEEIIDDNYVGDEEVDEIQLSEDDAAFLDTVILRCLVFLGEFCEVKLFPYQTEIAYRVMESILINDGQVITVEQARQSGKSEVLANVIATMMVLLPRLAKAYPAKFGKFSKGFLVGVFAPTEEQADTVWGRVVDRLTSERAVEFLVDPEIDDKVTKEGGKSKAIRLRKSGSLCRRQTCNPKAKIESKTYHFALIDECFPAGTPVLTTKGWTPIEEIVEGGDWVVATQEADGSLGWGDVTRTFKTPRYNDLVRVDFEHGSVYSTANHPFMVGGARVPAISLTPGTTLSVVPGAYQPFPYRECSESYDAVLLQLAQSDAPQSDERPAGAGQDARDAETHRPPPICEGGQWTRADRATAEALAAIGGGLGRRVCLEHRTTEAGRHAYALQDRLVLAGAEAGGGGRRVLPRDVQQAGAGQAEGGVFTESRVLGVTVLESGSPEFDQFSDGADFVYTLEVGSSSHTYVAGGVLVANCQEADSFVVEKSIGPMLAFTNGSRVYTGTPNRTKNVFYKTIQQNKRHQTKRGARQNHFSYDYRFVCKYNENYRKYIAVEKARIGEDSDEFQLSYCCKWLIDQGMFVTEDRLQALGDPGMKIMRAWWKSKVVVGVDPARTKDSTVVTVVWVDWDHPDSFGFFEHRILAWLEIHNQEWERQYYQIVDFLSNYNILRIGVDTTGMGSAVFERLAILFPEVDVIACPSDTKTQGARWKHLKSIIEREMLVFPAHASVRRTRPYKKFVQQMTDLETKFQGQYMLAEAPDETDAHDDYPDSLAIACSLSLVDTLEEATSMDTPWARRGGRR